MKIKSSWIHIAFIALIVIIAGTAAFRLYRWNKGTNKEEDIEQVDPSEFDVETMDMILPMESSLLEGHEDDGELTILCLGNNPFSDERGESGLASKIAEKTGATVYDCSFPDSSAACKYAEYNPQYTRDHFNFYYVVEFLRTQQFTAIESIAKDEPDPKYLEAVEVMKSVDMNKVDVMVIMYDSTDYEIGTPTDNPDNPYDVTAWTGGLRVTLERIKEAFPYIRIFVMSPTYAQYMDENGEVHSGTTYDLGNGAIPHYVLKEIDAVAGAGGVSFIDNYYGTINEDNYEEYMTEQSHYNEKGRDALAERIADIINHKMTTVSVAK